MIKRCFAFGCSFTHWFYWPTWADFIGVNYKEYYNFGIPGASNGMTHKRLIEANSFYKFDSEDLILIGITNFGRLNWLEEKNNQRSWSCHGGPQNWPGSTKTDFLRNNFWRQDYGIYDTWLMVENSIELFQAKHINYRFVMSLDNRYFLDNKTLDLTEKEIKMAEEIYNNFSNRQSLQEFSADQNHHPTAIEHSNSIEQFFPDLITEQSKIYRDEIVNSMKFNCNEEESVIYSKIRSRYFKDKSPVEFPMYGNYH